VTTARGGELSRGALVALVVGSMVGAGIFALPSAFARATGVLGALVAWTIAGTGMLMLALTFQTLARRKPALDAGVFAYAREGFGGYAGFVSAVGYWITCCLACVTCLVLVKATLGQFLPAFGDGTTPVAILAASGILWSAHALVMRGVKQAAALNTVATIAKVVPLAIFVVLVAVAFRADVFAANLWGGAPPGLAGVTDQARDAMLLTVFVFVGIEGASVYSRYAKRREDVGVATVLGFLSVLCLLVLVTTLSYAVLPRAELAALANPSMAGVLEAVVGPWGRVFVSAGLVVAVLGNFLSWVLLAAEVMRSAAGSATMPAAFARENAREVPAAALWASTLAIQALLVVAHFAEHAFTLALKMTSAMALVPYLLVGAYGAKLAYTRETYGADPRGRGRDLVVGALATVYAAAMIHAGGPRFLLLSALLYAPSTLLYAIARREQGRALFASVPERVAFGAMAAAAAGALYALATGAMSL
jgi:arginine:ornithine antiporter/lysine permease